VSVSPGSGLSRGSPEGLAGQAAVLGCWNIERQGMSGLSFHVKEELKVIDMPEEIKEKVSTEVRPNSDGC
jgi:hypothetical protein